MKRGSFSSLLYGVGVCLALVGLLTSDFVFGLSVEQRKLIDSGIGYFDLVDACRTDGGQAAPIATGASLAGAIKAADPFIGPQITPTAIILHYTVDVYTNDPEQIMAGLRSRVEEPLYPNGRAVQLFIADDGVVYQLADTLETKPTQTIEPDTSWNDVSVGIEIEGVGEADLMNNPTQYQTALGVVRDLMSRYNIVNEANFDAKHGIFGHYEVTETGNVDPGAGFMARVRNDLAQGTVTPITAPLPSTSYGTGGAANLNIGADFSLGTEGQERRVNLVKHLMVDFGLSAEQASGIVGNFMHESAGTATVAQTVPPDVNQGESVGAPPKFSGGYGWAQWTGGRQTRFIDFAVENGYMASRDVNATDGADYAYLKKELTESYTVTIDELKKQTTPEDAATSFEATFEKAGQPALAERTANARQVFTEYSQSPLSQDSNVCSGFGSAAIVGEYAFPLLTTKSTIGNPGMFANGTASTGGHPYTAYDILIPPGTPVAAFLSGTVTRIGTDRCGGRSIGIYNEASDLTISYLHLDLSGHVALGDTVVTGQQIATIGPAENGCGVAHLHIDAVSGPVRPDCSRLSCTETAQDKFVDIGPQLFETFQILPE